MKPSPAVNLLLSYLRLLDYDNRSPRVSSSSKGGPTETPTDQIAFRGIVGAQEMVYDVFEGAALVGEGGEDIGCYWKGLGGAVVVVEETEIGEEEVNRW